MAKLSEKSLKNLRFHPLQFAGFLQAGNFEAKGFFNRFEDRAEELDLKHPGKGYQLAYNEALTNAFGGLVAKHIRRDPELEMLTFNELIEHFDNMMMGPYFDARRKEGLEYEINMGIEAFDKEMIESFDSILQQATSRNLVAETNERFENGELTLDSVSRYAESLKDSYPSREDACKLAVYAEYLEKRNEDRPIIWMVLGFLTHFKELSTIKQMRAIAEKQAPVDVLLKEAVEGSRKLNDLVNDFTVIKNSDKPIFTEEVVQDIEEGIIDIEDRDLFLAGIEEIDVEEMGEEISFDEQDAIESDALAADDDDKLLAQSIKELLDAEEIAPKEPIKVSSKNDPSLSLK
jgi:hypothetical protein